MTNTLLYSTDPGALSAEVTHGQADAMVAAAAAVWTTPTSSLSLAQAGTLAEDVSTANTYFDGQEMVFPADVQLSNEDSVPVAVVYDVDGSLVDLLLGEGASEPDGCRQNAVVGDVDDIHQDDGSLRHATLILNGRCADGTPEQLTQMQYQLARAFGRVLGLSWSQTNDNVFTGEKTVTGHQVAYWPLMHPIDVICGPYSYQCMNNPFTLRVDDLNTLAQLYPVYQSSVPAGKRGSSDDALYLRGILYFPTGQGMQWVNITTRRLNNDITEDWETTSAVTGNLYQQALPTPVDQTAAANSGVSAYGLDGYFLFRRVPLDTISNVFFNTEAINPLYFGDYAVGAYVRPPVTPSGSPVFAGDYSALSTGDYAVNGFLTATDASATCDPGQDGTETAPAALDASGWQTGLLCGWGHSSWWTVNAAAGHGWTLEVTATDETGAATVNKVQPVLGLWNAGDPAGTLPTVASQVAPFNSLALGMTRVLVDGADTDGSYRMSITDQFGAGRPDFTYTARVLYASTVTPATVGLGGGRIVIAGTGFRQGNQVLVNGAPARIVSWSATQIVAYAPSMQAANADPGSPVMVTIADASTGGTATIPDAVAYAPQPNVMEVVSAPAAVETGVQAGVAFAVRVTASDGISPVTGTPVLFSVTAGSAQLGACNGLASCNVITDADGIAKTTVTGVAAGAITLTATEASGAAVQIALADTNPVRSVSLDPGGPYPDQYLAAGAAVSWTVSLTAMQDGLPIGGVPAMWNVTAGLVQQGAVSATGANGQAEVFLSSPGLAAGADATVTGCAWTTVCATWQLHGVDEAEWLIQATGDSGGSVSQTGSLGQVTLLVTDGAGHLLQGAPVSVYQRVLAWEGACPDQTRCAAAPVLSTAQSTLVSSANGEVTLTPLQLEGIPQVVEIAAATGSYGFVTLTLVKSP